MSFLPSCISFFTTFYLMFISKSHTTSLLFFLLLLLFHRSTLFSVNFYRTFLFHIYTWSNHINWFSVTFSYAALIFSCSQWVKQYYFRRYADQFARNCKQQLCNCFMLNYCFRLCPTITTKVLIYYMCIIFV